MNKKNSAFLTIFSIAVIVAIGALIWCFTSQKNTLTADVSSVLPGNPSGAVLAVKLSGITPVQANNFLFGFNTEKTFSTDLYKVSNAKDQIVSLQPDVLRFPGGMVGNFYHPKTKGYGFIYGEFPNLALYTGDYTWSQKQDKDLLDIFITYAKSLGITKVVYVANIYTGTVSEMNYVMDTLQTNGMTVVGVELGNEMMYKPMIDTIKNGAGYVAMAKPFADELRTKYPGIKIGAVAWYNSAVKSINGVNKNIGIIKTNDWMKTVSQNLSFDAWIIHHYPNVKTCEAKTDIASTFVCIRNLTNLQGDNFPNDLFSYVQGFAVKEIWVTEFNIDNPATRSGNTFLHAANIFEFLTLFQDQKMNGKLTLLTHHNLLSTAVGMPALYRIDGTIVKSAHGEAIALFKTAEKKITGTFTTRLEENPWGIDTRKDFVYRVYTTQNGILVVFTNKSNQPITLKLSDTVQRAYTNIADSSILQAQALYGSQRSPAYRLTGGKNWETKPMTPESIMVDVHASGVTIPAFSLGYVELQK